MSKTAEKKIGNRPLILRWIAALFARELTVEDVESYRTGEGRELFTVITQDVPDAVELETMRRVLTGPQSSEDVALDLAAAFSWLFHGVGGPKAAPTHWHDWSEASDGSQMACIETCAALMARCGLGPALDSDESADHVSVQLEFLSYLETQMALEPDGPWLGYRDRLVSDQLNAWFPHFLRACEQNDRSGFYAALAGLTRRVMPDGFTGTPNSTQAADAA
ncbi:hypothetical protein GO013_04410 [Pseudodesulfovibrio sp. JC047]|uniref:TorD/DmsD family molecular chaperone n=1 Tax=Pseudodesulfovibrio sp. JC047 TaxID=2683199 RepID=UPI0013D56C65|nr:molecular chaperone TorD family protein [Pseudodesulfovibrio sp. JC047]NDV18662.1 hypothetical protein [Pseudodesulfovibrio sp. JC047]